ncbi:acyl-CoA dehydrogenase family protein [Solwaraspora sp. WMMD792]|uniref:acyl-CoA dehydrogenase family protein n=1 Tax=Solwaraspora sp. WMMD792 TaxID=3016099 RepID=UPI0024172E80|nr:acyl-CoA dehydrogenase family protein [Solwaraspora sp. WMMD792]MDG4769864.1 acyl-CoA dehydrogenase family protein [Solwaraspora sp. WMMD792]
MPDTDTDTDTDQLRDSDQPGDPDRLRDPDQLRGVVAGFLRRHDRTGDRTAFLRARFDAGLAWVHHPVGLGGLGLPWHLQAVVDDEFTRAGAPDNRPRRNSIGLGMAAPTLLRHGTPQQQRRWLRPLWTGEEIWCQLFSEPDAGSDLAAVATRAERSGDGWLVDGQKVWTSLAHRARWAILLARTSSTGRCHAGLTYFVCDMTAPGVQVRPLRQLTGEAEFNEVFLTGVRLPDAMRIGEVGEGWQVARTTLMNERVAIGGRPLAREGGMIGVLTDVWRRHPEVRRTGPHQDLLRLWVRAEAARLTALRLRQQLVAGQPGPEGSAVKLSFAELNQLISGLEIEVSGAAGLRHDDWTMRRPEEPDLLGRTATYRYLRARGNSIEGGTSEILRNVIAERVLGLPSEPRVDR